MNTTSPTFNSGFKPPAKPQLKTSRGLWCARCRRRETSAFLRPMPVMRMETSAISTASFRNGAASSFRAKQTSVGILISVPLIIVTRWRIVVGGDGPAAVGIVDGAVPKHLDVIHVVVHKAHHVFGIV